MIFGRIFKLPEGGKKKKKKLKTNFSTSLKSMQGSILPKYKNNDKRKHLPIALFINTYTLIYYNHTFKICFFTEANYIYR